MIIGKAEISLKPTFANLKLLEARTGEKTFRFMKRFSDQEYGPADVVEAIYCLSGKSAPYEEVAEAVMKTGWIKYTPEIIETFLDSLGPQEPDEGKAEPRG